MGLVKIDPIDAINIGVLFLVAILVYSIYTHKTILPYEYVDEAQQLCQSHNGLDKIVVKIDNSATIICADGAEFH